MTCPTCSDDLYEAHGLVFHASHDVEACPVEQEKLVAEATAPPEEPAE